MQNDTWDEKVFLYMPETVIRDMFCTGLLPEGQGLHYSCKHSFKVSITGIIRSSCLCWILKVIFIMLGSSHNAFFLL